MITIAGRLDSALTHFALLGLANILSEAAAEDVRIRWRNGEPVSGEVTWSAEVDAAAAVLQHARRHARNESWVQASMPSGEPGLFSPRFKTPRDAAGWTAILNARQQHLDAMTALDCRLAGALGEPGYWLPADMSPDAAVSRWEMKTRNRGEHFIGHRLAPMAVVLAARQVEDIRDGLTGVRVVDEVGKGKQDSRTATGLVTPQPVDTALAWCGLWGLASMTLIPSARTFAATAGAWSLKEDRPQSLTLPIWGGPVSEPLWRAVVGSADFDRACHDGSLAESARDSLRRRGVIALIRFPQHITLTKARERMLRDGELIHLREPA